ncbi:GDSL esterase/lipase At5g41890-like [Musa acuminata AAA Group]|uniref:GDSL esterase/lipase At5g41890-like n=1 Tax=Musa acuminata AAA Group TaxID=214697 RepID=UPI0031DA8EA1
MASSVAASPPLCVLLFLLSLRPHPTASYTSFVFGDSLVDTGNNNYLFTISKADSPPYGIDFAPSGGQPTGRFTNGRTIIDVIVQGLGDSSFPPPYLAPNASSSSTIFVGVNYASGASGILDETGSLFIERIPLGKQVQYFEETRDYLVGTLGENATGKFLRNAVFSIIAGSNDILNYLEPSIPLFEKTKLPPVALQDMMVSNLTLHLKHLHELGARKFVVVGVGPLGCIPYIRVIKLVADGRCSSAANQLIQGYNMKLSRRIQELNEEMGPETVFVYANSYDIVRELMQNYLRYGFENVDDPCCGLSFPPLLCFGQHDGNSSSVLCKDRAKYVFWDAYHPTEAANIIIANKLLDGGATAATPFNLRRLYTSRS